MFLLQLAIRVFYMFIVFFFLSCHTPPSEVPEAEFEATAWKVKEGRDYPHRDGMLIDLMQNDSIRALNEEHMIELLGEPDRTQDHHLYYIIHQSRLGFWVLRQKTLVIKYTPADSVEWMKIHGG